MGTYAKLPEVRLLSLRYEVECIVDVEVEPGGEWGQDFEFEILGWKQLVDDAKPFPDSETIGEWLYDVIDTSPTLRADLRRRAIDNYDPTED